MTAGGDDGVIVLRDAEMAALMRESGPRHGGRVVQCAFGGGQAWLDPRTRDGHGNYPRWIVLRLAVMRGVPLSRADVSEAERVELAAFADANNRQIQWEPWGPVCRWALECEAPPVQVVEVSSLGFSVEACADHAADHAEWEARQVDRAARGKVTLTPDEEPRPECFCPTRPRLKVPYCPEHGTPDERGIEP